MPVALRLLLKDLETDFREGHIIADTTPTRLKREMYREEANPTLIRSQDKRELFKQGVWVAMIGRKDLCEKDRERTGGEPEHIEVVRTHGKADKEGVEPECYGST